MNAWLPKEPDMQSWPSKDPNENLDYQFDWSDRLVTGETISTSDFIKESGDVTLGAEDFSGALTTLWVSGGTHGSVSVITNRITTSAGRVYDESAKLRVRNK